MAVLRPIKVVITNFPEGNVEWLDAVNNPEDPAAGTRKVPFSRELWIEDADFQESPPPKYFRLRPGGEVRLRWAYVIRCEEVVKDADGRITELRCTYDPATRGGGSPDGRSPKATLHWVSAPHALSGEVRLYNHLFTRPDPGAAGDLLGDLNPDSEEVVAGARLEAALGGLHPGTRVQFERLGYFAVDRDSTAERPVFNRIVTLRDTWARVQAKNK